MKQKLFFLSLLILGSLIACERTDQQYGAAKSEFSGAPQSSGQAPGEQVSLVAAAAHVESVMPKGALDGQALYTKTCMACHQATGLGIPGAFPPLDKSAYVVSDNVERMAAIMIYGLQGPISVSGVTYTNVMAPQGALKDEELAAIATYVRSAWSNKAAPVSADVFAAVRKKHGGRGPFAISELGEEK